MKSRKKVVIVLPEETWSLFKETLTLDSQSPVFDRKLRDRIRSGLKEVERKELILTAYLDGGGNLQFHEGTAPFDFRHDMKECGARIESLTILKRFYIIGEIVRETGLTEPIRVR